MVCLNRCFDVFKKLIDVTLNSSAKCKRFCAIFQFCFCLSSVELMAIKFANIKQLVYDESLTVSQVVP